MITVIRTILINTNNFPMGTAGNDAGFGFDAFKADTVPEKGRFLDIFYRFK